MSKAISRIYKCNSCKKSLDDNEYVQVDIDRLIRHLETDCEAMKVSLDRGLFSGLEEIIQAQIDTYEGLLGMIKANSFN